MGGQKLLTLDSGLFGTANDRFDEFIGNVPSVTILDRLEQVISLDLVSLTISEGVDGELDPVPSLVTVHGVVTSSDSADLSESDLLDVILELLDVFGGRSGCGVSSVANVVDVDIFDLVVLCCAKQGEEVLNMRVDTSVRYETQQVQTRSVRSGAFHSCNDVWLLLKLILFDT